MLGMASNFNILKFKINNLRCKKKKNDFEINFIKLILLEQQILG